VTDEEFGALPTILMQLSSDDDTYGHVDDVFKTSPLTTPLLLSTSSIHSQDDDDDNFAICLTKKKTALKYLCCELGEGYGSLFHLLRIQPHPQSLRQQPPPPRRSTTNETKSTSVMMPTRHHSPPMMTMTTTTALSTTPLMAPLITSRHLPTATEQRE